MKRAIAIIISFVFLCPHSLFASQNTTYHESEQSKITVDQAVILGIIEGLTEYLPVSSTGHLIIATHAMGHTNYSGQTGVLGPKLKEGGSSFEIIIQMGAILAVAVLYRRKMKRLAMGLLGRDRMGLRLLSLIIVATLPAIIAGLLFHKPIKENLFTPRAVCLALAAGGIGMIAVEQLYRRRRVRRTTHIEAMAYHQALIIGLAQCLAMWPGTSRSMITIVAALLVGLDMVTAAEFSFILAIPTLAGATAFELAIFASAEIGSIVTGMVVSGLVAAAAVTFFIRWLTKHGLTPFGVYRIILAIVVYVYFIG